MGETGRTNVILPLESDWSFTNIGRPERPLLHDNDRVRSVDWLDQNIVIAGVRAGKVVLMDLRTLSSAVRLRHAEGINYVKAQNESQIVVAGVKEELCTYDLRFLPQRPKGRLRTEPRIRYPAYRCSDFECGFDVSSNLIASGTIDGCVQVFNCNTGEQLLCPSVLMDRPLQGNTTVKSLAFGDGVGRQGIPQMFVAAGNEMSVWS